MAQKDPWGDLMSKEIYDIPISDTASPLRSRVRNQSTEGFPPLNTPVPQSAYESAPPPPMPGAPAPQASGAEPTPQPASTTSSAAPAAAPVPPMAPPQMAPPQMTTPAASPAQTQAPKPETFPAPQMSSPSATVPPMAPPQMAPPQMTTPAASFSKPETTAAAASTAPPAAAFAAPAASTQSKVESPASSVPSSATAFGTLPTEVLNTSEPLEEDIDPSGRADTGATERANADPKLISALQDVVRLIASDLHVTSNAPPMLRVDGALQPVPDSTVWDREQVSDALMSLLTPAQAATYEENLELDFAFAVSEGARFRVNYYRQRDAIGGAFRLIPTEIKPLEQLGIPDTVSRFAELARGLVLVTGPTGSGKSTTLAALVDLVNRTRTDHIVTVEDPIEFMHGNKKSLINQREVGSDTHSFAAALKHVLRQDPDVILIGELRDLETISVALTAAETGHLVFATLHTQNAASTIDRVIDVFPPHQQEQVRAQLASTLQGVVCQTLVKMASGKGRVVATEVMVATPAIANLIREGKTYQIPTALQAGRDLGMYSMDQHLAELVDRGKITHAAAMEKAQDLEGLKRLINRVDSGAASASTQMAAAAHDFSESFSGMAN